MKRHCIHLLQDAPSAALSSTESKRRCQPHDNLSPQERSVLNDLRKLEIGFYIADKNLGPVIYSGDKFYEQCILHLFSPQGHYIQLDSTADWTE